MTDRAFYWTLGTVVAAFLAVAVWFVSSLNGWAAERLAKEAAESAKYEADMRAAGCRVTDFVTNGRYGIREKWTCADGKVYLGRSV